MIFETSLDRARKRMQSSKFPRLNRKTVESFFKRAEFKVFNLT